MHSQTTSPFFTQLPAEIRSQIYAEYLDGLLQSASASVGQDSYAYAFLVPRQKSSGVAGTELSTSLLSPFAVSCKRVLREMHHKEDPTNFALLSAKTPQPGAGISDMEAPSEEFIANWIGLASNEEIRWHRVQRIRFVIKRDDATAEWLKFFIGVLKAAPNLKEIELVWDSPRQKKTCVFGECNSGRVLRHIQKCSPARTIRLQGNVPNSWLERIGAVPGKTIVVG
ncbi:unnamed protein product [Clonostachys rhizophaga]|uniref:Uncharacterized protein n=1 Tax=Clonostachys rhizophaga TaxID=160324 RepID=A0A9N9VP63_9HYPO|nr:unnamed protein product [Clonostachys rhizophaga]